MLVWVCTLLSFCTIWLDEKTISDCTTTCDSNQRDSPSIGSKWETTIWLDSWHPLVTGGSTTTWSHARSLVSTRAQLVSYWEAAKSQVKTLTFKHALLLIRGLANQTKSMSRFPRNRTKEKYPWKKKFRKLKILFLIGFCLNLDQCAAVRMPNFVFMGWVES